MRNPERISRISIKFDMAWKKYPDYRFGQMVSNLLGPGPHDVFFMEDDQWEALLDAMLTTKELDLVNQLLNNSKNEST